MDDFPSYEGLNAWIWEEGESPIPLTDSKDALWIGLSDDGEYAAYTRGKEGNVAELWAARLPGGEAVRLASPQAFSDMRGHPEEAAIPMDLHWVPGTHTVGFHTNLAGSWMGFRYTPDNLWWVDAETGEAVSKPVDGEIFYSPDGALAAGVNREHLFLMNADGSGQRIVPLENYHTIPYGDTYNEPPRIHWAEDSQSIFVIAPETVKAAETAHPDAMVTIWRVGVQNGQAVPFARYTADYETIRFSGDHRWAAYIRWVVEGKADRRELHLSTSDGSEDLLYHEGELLDGIYWSPDSRHFFYWVNSLPYLGDVCGPPIPLADTPLLTRWGSPVTEFHFAWIDRNRFILGAGDYKELLLYRGDLSGREAILRRWPDFFAAKFDVLVIPDSL
jgi:hypothetical protein